MIDAMHMVVLKGLQKRMVRRGCNGCKRLMAHGGCSALGRADGRAGCPFYEAAAVVPPKQRKVVGK